jgi:hypothetical protein
MISPLPPNIVYSLIAVPVLEWVTVEPAHEPAPPPQAMPSCNEGIEQTQPPEAPTPAPAPIKRLVLKGFEWRPAAEYVLFPPAPWANWLNVASPEAAEDSARQDRERQARADEAARDDAAQIARLRAGEGLDALKEKQAAKPESGSTE